LLLFTDARNCIGTTLKAGQSPKLGRDPGAIAISFTRGLMASITALNGRTSAANYNRISPIASAGADIPDREKVRKRRYRDVIVRSLRGFRSRLRVARGITRHSVRFVEGKREPVRCCLQAAVTYGNSHGNKLHAEFPCINRIVGELVG